ncbi:Signal peptidase I [hydrothermal vent metagenome]|uniref:Signal peptidase I n=1 Tax=hydrothermal vent metagenome TaxID=652676 RepID=A0A3B0REP6_9ZZZZ
MSDDKLEISYAGKIWNFIREPVIVIMVFLGVHSFAYAQYEIWPSESMVPTLEIGDRIIVNKYAYGYSRHSLPFGMGGFDGRIMGKLPERGDVVVFADPKDTGRTMIKRIIGLPGDEIQLIRGRLFLNGHILPRHYEKSYSYREPAGHMVSVREFSEENPEGRRYHIAERTDFGRLDNTVGYRVPPGHVFAMGDNRDNSGDSRILNATGYIPVENLIGRAEVVVISLYDCDDGKDIECKFGMAFSRFFKKVI